MPILNDATNILVGTTPATSVYAGSNLVWSAVPPEPVGYTFYQSSFVPPLIADDSSAASGLTLFSEFSSDIVGNWTGGRFYIDATGVPLFANTTLTAYLWAENNLVWGAHVATGTLVVPASPPVGWIEVPFSSPYPYTSTATSFWLGIKQTAGRYPYGGTYNTNEQPPSGIGPINKGRAGYRYDAATGSPGTFQMGSSFYVDAVFEG